MSTVVANGTYFGRPLLVRQSAGLALAETQYNAGVVVPRHAHETALCVLVLEGAFEEQSDRKRQTCAPGTLVFLPAGAEHAHRFPARRSRAFTVQFGKDWTDRLIACDVRLPALGQIQTQGAATLNAALLYRDFRRGDDGELFLDEGAVHTLDGIVGRAQKDANETSAAWLKRTREYIAAHFRESFSLTHLAQLADVHPAYLSRAFRRHTGETLSACVRRLRLEHAAQRLARDTVSISLIGIDAGFADHSHFTREFKRATGTTPQSYRALFSPGRAARDLPSVL
jgi:AraC-like DNA-binding protein/quercetin dioxygenase-like cupin family protein